MPKTKFLSRSDKESSPNDSNIEESSPHVLQVYKDYDSDEEDSLKLSSSQRFQQSQHSTISANVKDVSLCGSKGNENIQKNIKKNQFLSLSDPRTIPLSGSISNSANQFENIVRTNKKNKNQNQNQKHHTSISLSADSSDMPRNKNKSQNQKNSQNKLILSNDDILHIRGKNENQLEMKILDAKKKNCCFFCLKASPQILVPACAGWLPHTLHEDQIAGGSSRIPEQGLDSSGMITVMMRMITIMIMRIMIMIFTTIITIMIVIVMIVFTIIVIMIMIIII